MPSGDAVQQRYPARALREYAVLADGQRGAVCGPGGEIVWLCAPCWHDDAVFSALLGGAGAYAITPVEPHVWGGAYEPRSLIWRSHWATTRTQIESREALAYPGDPGRVVLLRRIQPVEREATVAVELDVRARFRREPMRDPVLGSDGRWTARTGELRIRWSGGRDAHLDEDGVLRARIPVAAGQHHDLVLEIGRDELGEHVDPDAAWRNTEAAWADAVPELTGAAGPRDAQHAVAVLRGMTTPGRGMVAAVTMSLPERAEHGGNYDYRYSWIRDQCYAGVAAAEAGVMSLLDDAVAFVGARLDEDGEDLEPAYTVHGEPIPGEEPLPHLPGYPGGQTLVRGNRVTHQFQLDAFGEILQLLAAAAERGRLDTTRMATAESAVAIIERNWDRSEAGLWELDERWWTHSRLCCVAGLRRFAAATADFAQAGRMLVLADALLAETSRRCLHPDGHWQRSPDDPRPDAAMLLPLVRDGRGFADPRTAATVEAVRDRLCQDGYVYRFPQDPDPLGEREGAFLLCGFAMALADEQLGNEIWALRWFERHRAACGPPALLAEEYDVHQRQLRGNLPQAFVHAMLLESAVRLSPS